MARTRKNKLSRISSTIPTHKEMGGTVGHNKTMNNAQNKGKAVQVGRDSSSGQFVRGRIERSTSGHEYIHIDLG